MNRFTKLLAAVLAAALLLSLTACGKKTHGKYYETVKTKDGTHWYLGGGSFWQTLDGSIHLEESTARPLLENVPDTLDPGQVYAGVTLTEQMLHGVYTLNNKESGLKAFRKQTPFQELTFPGGTYSMTVLPTAVYFGSQYVTCSGTGYKYSNLKYLEGYEVAVVEFAMEDKLGFMPAIYELQGNTVVFRHIETSGFKADDFSWQLSGVELSFDITLTGPYITFATGDHTVQLMAYALSENPESLPTLRGYSLPDSALVAGLDFFSCNAGYVYGADRTGHYYDIIAFKLDEAGRLTLHIYDQNTEGEPLSVTKQFAYILQSSGDSGYPVCNLILLDGSKVYFYTDSSLQREARSLEAAGIDTDSMTEDQITHIADKKEDIFTQLQTGFEETGIAVTINRSTGEITLDQDVLFGVNESEVSEAGKVFLQKFMGVFTAVVLSEENRDSIASVVVEGHTDASGSYEGNLKLSKARADSVAAFCMSDAAGLSPAFAHLMQELTVTVGYSSDRPVYDRNGNVDAAASRRVSFRIQIKAE